MWRQRLAEDDGFIVVDEDAALGVSPEGAGEDDFLEVFSASDEVLDGVAVGDMDDVLSDDGAFVEVFGDVV